MTISSTGLGFFNEATEQLNCSFSGDAMTIGFNAKFLGEMLSVLKMMILAASAFHTKESWSHRTFKQKRIRRSTFDVGCASHDGQIKYLHETGLFFGSFNPVHIGH
ncbi:MAG: hypothetical protein IPJ39_22365 [Saprospiraceae bacterium]|nr:hypothetical protein [Saprospiraceae bacterium]